MPMRHLDNSVKNASFIVLFCWLRDMARANSRHKVWQKKHKTSICSTSRLSCFRPSWVVHKTFCINSECRNVLSCLTHMVFWWAERRQKILPLPFIDQIRFSYIVQLPIWILQLHFLTHSMWARCFCLHEIWCELSESLDPSYHLPANVEWPVDTNECAPN